MALITCPECGKQISESAKSCPNCGYPFVKEVASTPKPQQVEVTSINLRPPSFMNKLRIATGLLIFIFIIACLIALIAYQKTKKESKYIENLNTISSAMLSGASKAESLCDLTYKVWSNTIYKKYDDETDKYTLRSNVSYRAFYSDFNNSLANLFADQDIKNQMSVIESKQTYVSDLMKYVSNPSKKLEKCYDTLNDLFTAYMGLTDLAIHPTGSLQTFSQNKIEKVEKFMDNYRKLNAQIPK
jgi:hypothetical protein